MKIILVEVRNVINSLFHQISYTCLCEQYADTNWTCSILDPFHSTLFNPSLKSIFQKKAIPVVPTVTLSMLKISLEGE